MSYILDALKKIEHEKNKKVLPDGRVSISGDLFQERKLPASKTGFWKVLVLIVLASLVTFAGTWFAIHGQGTKNAAVVHPVIPAPTALVPPPVVTLANPVPVQSQASSVIVPPSAPSATVPALQTVMKSAEAVANDEYPVRKTGRSKKPKKVPSSPKQPVQAVQTVQAPADIKLSGIAWQDERSARRAVVNGFLLKEGAVVSGAIISDIQADRVRFSSSAGIFEIKLDAVLPAEVRR